MQEQKGNNIIYLVVVGVFIALVYLFVQLYFKDGEVSLISNKNNDSVKDIKTKTKNVEDIKNNIFEEAKYSELDYTEFEKVDFNEYEIGNPRPFMEKKE